MRATTRTTFCVPARELGMLESVRVSCQQRVQPPIRLLLPTGAVGPLLLPLCNVDPSPTVPTACVAGSCTGTRQWSGTEAWSGTRSSKVPDWLASGGCLHAACAAKLIGQPESCLPLQAPMRFGTRCSARPARCGLKARHGLAARCSTNAFQPPACPWWTSSAAWAACQRASPWPASRWAAGGGGCALQRWRAAAAALP
jgi:hypothetical protein